MKNPHIVEMLDRRPPGGWTEEQESQIERHVQQCDPCRKAWKAAEAASRLLRLASPNAPPVPAGFAQRVMFAMEDRAAVFELPFVLRLWQASGRLVFALAAAALMLLLVVESRGGIQLSWPSSRAAEISPMNLAYDIALGVTEENGINQ